MKRREFLRNSGALMGGAVLGPGLHSIAAHAADGPVRGGTLIWGHSETTQNLDIHKTGTASTVRLLQNVHDAIVTVDENFTLIPSLAERFEQSPDGLTYTFHLRAGVRFHDGSEMTSGGRQVLLRAREGPRDRGGQLRGLQRRGGDRDAGRSHRRHSHDPGERAVPQPPSPRTARGSSFPRGAPATPRARPRPAPGRSSSCAASSGNEVEIVRFDDYWGGAPYLDGILSRER